MKKRIFLCFIQLIIITLLISSCVQTAPLIGDEDEISYTTTDPGYDPADPNNNIYKVTYTIKDSGVTITQIIEYLIDQSGNLYRIIYKNSSGQILGYDNYSAADPDNYIIRTYDNGTLVSISQQSKDVSGNITRIYTEYNPNGKKAYYYKYIIDTHNHDIYDESIEYDISEVITDYSKQTTDYVYNANGDFEQRTINEYDQFGALVYGPETDTYLYTYDGSNKKITCLDVNWGELTTYTYYPNGNLESEITTDNTDGYIIYKYLSDYDGNNNLTSGKGYYDYDYDGSYNPLEYILDDYNYAFNANNDITLAKDFEYTYDAKGTLSEADDTVTYTDFYWWTVYNYLPNGRYTGYTDYEENGSTINETCEASYLFYDKGIINIDNKLLIKLSRTNKEMKKQLLKKLSNKRIKK